MAELVLSSANFSQWGPCKPCCMSCSCIQPREPWAIPVWASECLPQGPGNCGVCCSEPEDADAIQTGLPIGKWDFHGFSLRLKAKLKDHDWLKWTCARCWILCDSFDSVTFCLIIFAVACPHEEFPKYTKTWHHAVFLPFTVPFSDMQVSETGG